MLRELHEELGIPADYGLAGELPGFDEASELVDAGPNLIGRKVELAPDAFRAWLELNAAAAESGVLLLLGSGYRSWDYQASLIRKKLNNGQSIGEILRVNAAPGFSEHHTGRAIDIATPGSRPLTEEFEATAAFAWLTREAGAFRFRMSYPRDNPQGFVYEPWHWTFQRD